MNNRKFHRVFQSILLVCAIVPLALSACAQKQKKHSVGKVDGNPTHIALDLYPLATDKVNKTSADWKPVLSPKQYDILRNAGTEAPGTGSLLHNDLTGVYKCAACGNPLFSSATKFDSGTGWPSFWAPIEPGRVTEKSDRSEGMKRTEVLCGRCSGHLGHVFDDGPQPTGLRYCMNSEAMKFDLKK